MNSSARGAARSHDHRILSGVVLIFFGVACALGIAELGLRLIGYADPRFYVPDEQVGFALTPGAAGRFTREGRSYFTVNSSGRHDADVPLAKPSHTLRIAVLGDSFTEAKQVPIEQNFCSVMERELPKCPTSNGEPVEVMNFGVAGYSTAQELITLQDRVWPYSPDIVVLAFFTGNDVLDNSLTLGQTRQRPFFVRRDGKWMLDNSFREERHYRKAVTRRASFGTWLRDRVRIIQLLEDVRRTAGTDESHAEAGESSPTMYRPPVTPELHDAWDTTEYLLERMNGDVTAHQARFLVVTLSNSIQVYPDSRVRDAFAGRYAIGNLFYPDYRLESFGRSHGIDVRSLAEPFQRYADAHGVYLHGFENSQLGHGHWNSEGHRLAGEMIAGWICEMLRRNRYGEPPTTGATPDAH
jgi:lysophospholipase L1-like esterase